MQSGNQANAGAQYQQPQYSQQIQVGQYQQQVPQGHTNPLMQQKSGGSVGADGKRRDSDASEEAEKPTAPPLEEMETIGSYVEIVNPNVSFVPPPPSYEQSLQAPTQPSDNADTFKTVSTITEEEARRCLIEYADSKCCWGTRAARNMEIKKITASNAVHYVLETFLESRNTDWTSEPFVGQHVDVAQNGTPPQPWEIEVPCPSWFEDEEFKIEVPHTASVRMCHGCQGCQTIVCRQCMGRGRRHCYSCNGTGKSGNDDNQRPCYNCNGTGYDRCLTCRGMGRVTCKTCNGAGQVKYFIQLTVSFKTQKKDFILERTSLPDHLIRNVEGKTLFEDTQPLVHPVQSFPEQQVNQQSATIVQEHRGLARSGRIWAQRQRIRSVPVFQCDCEVKGQPAQFFVYGEEWCVYTDSYPDTCCWGCQLL